MNLFIQPSGEIITLGDLPPELEASGQITRRRVSTILPVNRLKRGAFLALRALFGERGRVAEWTRRWSGPWTATILATGETYTHLSRRACLAWEHKRIEKRLCQST